MSADDAQSLSQQQPLAPAPPLSSSSETSAPARELTSVIVRRHARAFVSGLGFLLVAYDLFAINPVMAVLHYLYPTEGESQVAGFVATGVIIGIIIGQLFFGIIADRVPKKPAFVAVSVIVLLGGLLSAAATWNTFAPQFSIFAWLLLWRCFLGLGFGGEYPLSASVVSTSHADPSPSLMSATFSMQGVGIVTAGIVSVILFAVVPQESVAVVFRVLLALESLIALPAIVTRLRMDIKPSPRATVSYWYTMKLEWRKLIGTAGSWFLFDIVFYANGLFSGRVLQLLSGNGPIDPYQRVVLTAEQVAIIGALALPGYVMSVLLINRIGARRLQVLGFVGMAVVFLVTGGVFDQLQQVPALFVIMYGMTFFFSNFGPNTTTYVLPALLYDPSVRATCHGISSASGKLGALLGGLIMTPLLNAAGVRYVMLVCGGISVLGTLLTLLAVPADADPWITYDKVRRRLVCHWACCRRRSYNVQNE